MEAQKMQARLWSLATGFIICAASTWYMMWQRGPKASLLLQELCLLLEKHRLPGEAGMDGYHVVLQSALDRFTAKSQAAGLTLCLPSFSPRDPVSEFL